MALVAARGSMRGPFGMSILSFGDSRSCRCHSSGGSRVRGRLGERHGHGHVGKRAGRLPGLYDTTCASVSASYDPKFDDDEVERIQGDLTYEFDWSAGPGGEITNQDPAAPSTQDNSSCDVGFSTASATVDDKTTEPTCGKREDADH